MTLARRAVELAEDKQASDIVMLDLQKLNTVADYFVGGLVALGDIIRWDFARTPNVERWFARVKALPSWKAVSEAHDGFAASLKEQAFVNG